MTALVAHSMGAVVSIGTESRSIRRASDPGTVILARSYTGVTVQLLTRVELSPQTAGLNRLIVGAIGQIGTLRESVVATQAYNAAEELSAALNKYNTDGRPAFTLSESEDGSAALEWRFFDRRLAVTLELDKEESGWHFVSLPSSGGAFLTGSLVGWSPRELIAQMLDCR